MGFNDLIQAGYAAKKEEVLVTVGDKEVTFYANEITHLQRLNISVLQNSGADFYTQLVVYSITDENGQHMTKEQAAALPPEYAEKFFIAAAKVNAKDEQEKKA
jgi:NAD-specific glutamate dehydrogenase